MGASVPRAFCREYTWLKYGLCIKVIFSLVAEDFHHKYMGVLNLITMIIDPTY